MDCSLPWVFPGKNPGVDCHLLLQGIFPTQGFNPCLRNCRWILYMLRDWGIISILKTKTFRVRLTIPQLIGYGSCIWIQVSVIPQSVPFSKPILYSDDKEWSLYSASYYSPCVFFSNYIILLQKCKNIMPCDLINIQNYYEIYININK